MNEKKGNFRAYIVLTVVCLAYFIPNYAQYQMSPIRNEIMQLFSLDERQFTSIFSAPMIPGFFLSLVAGLLVDKFGIKKVITIALLVTTLGIILRLFTTDYALMFIFMISIGAGPTFLNVNAAKILGGWFAPDKISGAMGFFVAASTVGMAAGIGTTALFPSYYSAFVLAAVLAVIIVLLWIFFMKEPQQQAQVQESVSMIESLRVVLKTPSVWIAGAGLLAIMATNITVSSSMPAALQERGLSSVMAGAVSAIVMIGNFLGCIVAPNLAARLKKQKLIMIGMSVLGAVFTVACWYAPQGLPLIICLLLVGISMGSVMPLLAAVPIQLPQIGAKYAGTAGGITGTLQLLGAVGVPTYILVPIADGNRAVLFILAGACMLLAGVCSALLPNLGKKK
ncbi:MAG: MFS transporter [Lachnospiraceae bacterium]